MAASISPWLALLLRLSKWQSRSIEILPPSYCRTAKQGQRSDRSAARMRRRSGIAICPLTFMIHLIGEHGAQDGMAEMVVALAASKVGEQLLDGVVDMFFRKL